jgi:DNA-binding transcriptional LysR family regulator
MNDQQMRSFVSVAKHKNISRAAEELHISQQGLSRIISVFEGELGAKLFTRIGGGVELTALGSMILPVVTSMLKGYEEYMNIINGIIEKHSDTVIVTYEHALFPTGIPFDITARLENINFKTLIAGSIDTCITQVLSGTADIGFCHNNGNFGELEYIPLIHEPVTVFMHRDHYLAGKNELVPSDLNGTPLLFPTDTFPKGVMDLFEICRNEGFYPDYALKSNDPNILLGTLKDKTSVLLGSRYTFAPPRDIIGIPLIHELTKIEMGFLVKSPVKKSALSFIGAVKQYYDPNS